MHSLLLAMHDARHMPGKWRTCLIFPASGPGTVSGISVFGDGEACRIGPRPPSPRVTRPFPPAVGQPRPDAAPAIAGKAGHACKVLALRPRGPCDRQVCGRDVCPSLTGMPGIQGERPGMRRRGGTIGHGARGCRCARGQRRRGFRKRNILYIII